MAHTAHTVHCCACGGTIPLPGLVARVACPFCARIQVLSDARLIELAGYEREVARQLGRAEQERAQIATWQAWTGGRGGRSRVGVAEALGLFGVTVVVAYGLLGVTWTMMTSSNATVRSSASFVVPIGLPLVTAAALVGYMLWYYGGRTRADAAELPRSTRGACPRCGAESLLAPGQVLGRCAYCGVALLPSATMMAEGQNAADLQLHRAELARYRAERSGIAAVMRMSAANVMPYIVIGSFLPMTLGAAISFTASTAARGTAGPELAVIWAIGGLNAALLVLVVLRRRSIAARWAHVVAVASHGFAHRAVVGVDGLVDWLNAYWAGAVPLDQIYAGPQFQASAVVIDDFLGLVVVNPAPLSEDYPVHAAVHLAAWIPSVHGRGAGIPLAEASAAVERFGFRLDIDGAGLRAYATDRITARLAKSGRGGEDLAAVAQILLLTARSLGARAVPPG